MVAPHRSNRRKRATQEDADFGDMPDAGWSSGSLPENLIKPGFNHIDKNDFFSVSICRWHRLKAL